MRLTLSLFFVGSFISSSFETSSVGNVDSTPIRNEAGKAISNSRDDNDDYIAEDTDFEDDEFDGLKNFLTANEGGVYSITHLHQERGEILVPCFGMWWPVGGGAPSYDYYYGGDDYGDYRRKRRRSRKRKKAAKMKRKKS